VRAAVTMTADRRSGESRPRRPWRHERACGRRARPGPQAGTPSSLTVSSAHGRESAELERRTERHSSGVVSIESPKRSERACGRARPCGAGGTLGVPDSHGRTPELPGCGLCGQPARADTRGREDTSGREDSRRRGNGVLLCEHLGHGPLQAPVPSRVLRGGVLGERQTRELLGCRDNPGRRRGSCSRFSQASRPRGCTAEISRCCLRMRGDPQSAGSARVRRLAPEERLRIVFDQASLNRRGGRESEVTTASKAPSKARRRMRVAALRRPQPRTRGGRRAVASMPLGRLDEETSANVGTIRRRFGDERRARSA